MAGKSPSSPIQNSFQENPSRVTLQPSSKTSYVVLGDNAGPSKLAAIKKHGLETLSEDAFLALIGTRVGPGGPGGAPLDDKTRKKMAREKEAIEAAAKALEVREKKEAREAKAKPSGYVVLVGQRGVAVSSLDADNCAPVLVRNRTWHRSSGRHVMHLRRSKRFAGTRVR